MSDTFVLVHGAWHGGWTWRPVAEHLRAAGHRVLTPTLPGLADGDDPGAHSLADLADFVVDLVEREDLRDVTLVGHSWGGYVVTGAAPRLATRLAKLIYYSAFVPAAGRSLLDEVPPGHREMFDESVAASGSKTITLPYEVWQHAFMQDAEEHVQHLVYQFLTPQPVQYFTETVEPLDEWFTVPTRYVLSIDDIVMPPGEFGWDRFAARLGVTPSTAPGSHEAMFTHPQGLASSLLAA